MYTYLVVSVVLAIELFVESVGFSLKLVEFVILLISAVALIYSERSPIHKGVKVMWIAIVWLSLYFGYYMSGIVVMTFYVSLGIGEIINVSRDYKKYSKMAIKDWVMLVIAVSAVLVKTLLDSWSMYQGGEFIAAILIIAMAWVTIVGKDVFNRNIQITLLILSLPFVGSPLFLFAVIVTVAVINASIRFAHHVGDIQ
ncbi:MAG: hypothetical protein HYV39_03015 [Candidatus Levybacteria bacterium]|nr:hypothetical protein [Candidatus Levybacteria bacterium]